MEFFIYINFIWLHNPSPIGMNALQETANLAKNHTYYMQELISPAPFVNNPALSLPMTPDMLLWPCTELLSAHNGYFKDYPAYCLGGGIRSLQLIKMFSRIFLTIDFFLSYVSHPGWSQLSWCLNSNKTYQEKYPWAPSLNQQSHCIPTFYHTLAFITNQNYFINLYVFSHFFTPPTIRTILFTFPHPALRKLTWNIMGTLIVVRWIRKEGMRLSV